MAKQKTRAKRLKVYKLDPDTGLISKLKIEFNGEITTFGPRFEYVYKCGKELCYCKSENIDKLVHCKWHTFDMTERQVKAAIQGAIFNKRQDALEELKKWHQLYTKLKENS